MADISLNTAILRYKAVKYVHLAKQSEAEDRGEDDHIPVDYWDKIEVLEEWDRPAETLGEAMEALEFAIEDYEAGETPRIPAMMKAALGWMKADAERRAAE
ncbi:MULTISPECIES: hypothetical protein [unclassified Shinella]|uniref:hypothetical protein n=1 Tax=unclassified Shinella TaxID=2643062 RepID=UPI00225CCB3A|nr:MULTISPECIES: hypothetical protein [unclassified Shinella]MCO5140855.1 hypothetical protein [Shinella sp.]MDC7256456.1 hypothetical protein [Shinella sp. YE25]CAI0339324.1 hypothetical protein SHINE37_43178 [Rhizobiaceae bacterium]CAK7257731.1 protein of unknown function [Shinella sp. WSC3-e]